MVPLHILWSVDSTKDISRQSQFLLNFDPDNFLSTPWTTLIQGTVLTGACQCFRGQILVSSGTFLMSLALLVTSCYMKNFGRCTVFSFQLFCWGRHHPKCSQQQRVWSLCEKGFLAPGLLFCIFFSSPHVFVHCWWIMGQSLVVALLDEQQAPRQSQGKARERSCGSTALTVSSIRRWMTGKVMKRMWIIFFSLSLILLVCFYLSWWDGRSVEAFLVIPTLWGKAMALQALKKQGKTSRYAGMRNQA